MVTQNSQPVARIRSTLLIDCSNHSLMMPSLLIGEKLVLFILFAINQLVVAAGLSWPPTNWKRGMLSSMVLFMRFLSNTSLIVIPMTTVATVDGPQMLSDSLMKRVQEQDKSIRTPIKKEPAIKIILNLFTLLLLLHPLRSMAVTYRSSWLL